jgi:hypothetical protein
MEDVLGSLLYATGTPTLPFGLIVIRGSDQSGMCRLPCYNLSDRHSIRMVFILGHSR